MLGARGEPALRGDSRENPRFAERQAHAVGGVEDGIEPGHGDARGEEGALRAAGAAGRPDRDEQAGAEAASGPTGGRGSNFHGDRDSNLD